MSCEDKNKTHRRTVSAGDAFSVTDLSNSLDKCSITDSVPHNGKIAQACSPKITRHFIQGLSATWSGKPPKMPQPEQAELTFSIISGGLREIIKLAQSDLINLKFAVESSSLSSHSQGKLYDLEKQIKAAERYLKKLEFHLSKLEELQEKYEVQKKMRDGIRSMTNAYIISHGKKRDAALHNVHTGYKECNELLCAYEAKLQHMMGTFTFDMIGIQGFARICCGDIFEIVIKHGDQKWRCRGYVLKNSKQSWDNKRILFRAIFKEPLYIKAIEIRGLGKNVLLGNKYCETKDLFSAHPQQMTINLNPSGSLKLSLVITWNPVHGFLDEIPLHSRPSFGSQSILIKDEIFSALKMPQDFQENTILEKEELVQQTYSSCEEISSIANEENIPIVSAEKCAVQQGYDFSNSSLLELDAYSHPFCNSAHKTSIGNNLQIWSSAQSINSSEYNSIEMASSSELSCSNSSRLQDGLHSLSLCLENILVQYPELQELCNTVLEIENLLKFQQQKSLGSDVSISIKSALGCFDFLNTAVDEDDDVDVNSESMMETKTVSNMAYLHYFNNEDPSTNSLGCSPEPFSSGIEQLDVVILSHTDYCLKMTDKLCSTSPLKCLEFSSLQLLQRQTSCFTSFLKLIRRKSANDRMLSCGDIFLENESELKLLWLRLAQVDSICLTMDQILPSFEKLIQSIANELDESDTLEVAARILCQILGRKSFSPETIVTAHQFRLYFSEKNSLHSLIEDAVNEVHILELLCSRQAEKAFGLLKQYTPFKEALLDISCLLIEGEVCLKRLSENYLKEISTDTSSKRKAITSFLEGLESEERRIRQGSCAALRIMNAFECCEQLVYISYADESQQVRHEAKVTLFAFGDTGRKLYEDYEKFTTCSRS